jgi:hydrogenase maturation protein HypF
MTSGNLSDEPICIDNEDATTRLRGIADAFLLHDREIVARYDDRDPVLAHGAPSFAGRAFVRAALRLPSGVGRCSRRGPS